LRQVAPEKPGRDDRGQDDRQAARMPISGALGWLRKLTGNSSGSRTVLTPFWTICAEAPAGRCRRRLPDARALVAVGLGGRGHRLGAALPARADRRARARRPTIGLHQRGRRQLISVCANCATRAIRSGDRTTFR
jgi:hypothetical protein